MRGFIIHAGKNIVWNAMAIILICAGGMVPVEAQAQGADDYCTQNPSIGAQQSNGSIYVGKSPLDGSSIFMTSSRYEKSLEWSPKILGNGKQMNSSVDGRANVSEMRKISSASGFSNDFPAAHYCSTLSAHGSGGWYLPAGGNGDETELNLLWKMVRCKGTVDGLGKRADTLWSSSESTKVKVWFQRFSDGRRMNGIKSASRTVRCIRRSMY